MTFVDKNECVLARPATQLPNDQMDWGSQGIPIRLLIAAKLIGHLYPYFEDKDADLAARALMHADLLIAKHNETYAKPDAQA